MAAVIAAGTAMTGRALSADCAIATKGESPVARACNEGGLIQAKRTMRDLVKKGRAAGTKFECDDCHKNDTNYELTAQARDNFKRLLAAADIKK